MCCRVADLQHVASTTAACILAVVCQAKQRGILEDSSSEDKLEEGISREPTAASARSGLTLSAQSALGLLRLDEFCIIFDMLL
jgi:hypothetical protein